MSMERKNVLVKTRTHLKRATPAARPSRTSSPERPLIECNRSGMFYQLDRSTPAMVSMVCCLRQARHVRKERRRLADEETHVRQERESPHRNAARVGRSDN